MIWLMVFSQMSLIGGSESSRIRLQINFKMLLYRQLQDKISCVNPSSAVQKVLLLILNNLRCFSAVFLHYILHRFRTDWQT
jgi:hypothetical protein